MMMHVLVSEKIRQTMNITTNTVTHAETDLDHLQKAVATGIKSSTGAKAVLMFDHPTSEHTDGTLHATIVCLSFPPELWATILSMAMTNDQRPTMLQIWVVKGLDANELHFGSDPPYQDAVAVHTKQGAVRPAHVSISVSDFQALGAQ